MLIILFNIFFNQMIICIEMKKRIIYFLSINNLIKIYMYLNIMKIKQDIQVCKVDYGITIKVVKVVSNFRKLIVLIILLLYRVFELLYLRKGS